MKSLTMNVRNAAHVIAGTCLAVAMAALVLHAPGQVSMDTSVQLYEAKTGISISWSPPFMSALLRWLGGGEPALAWFILINTVLLYGGLAALACHLARQRVEHGQARLALWRVLLSVALVANPIVFIYAGIVWKDVLFASLLTAGASSGIIAASSFGSRRWLCAALSLVLLAAAMLTRQQGMFMAPLLLLPLILVPAPQKCHLSLRSACVAIACFVVLVFAMKTAVNASIADEDSKSTDVGFRSVMAFDMAGIVSRSTRPAGEFAYPISEAQLAAVRSVYRPSRIDYLDRDPSARDWLLKKTAPDLQPGWWQLVSQNPYAYLDHRLGAYGVLLGSQGVKDTLPLHVGVAGNPVYLKAVDLQDGQGPRAQLIYRFASTFFNWPIYRHVFWLLLLALGAILGLRYTRLPQPAHASMLVLAAACALFYLSYLPTTIASDFRYLFPAIPLVSLQWLMLLLAPRGKPFPVAEPRSN